MTRDELRAELQKRLPGYVWVIRRALPLSAEGAISSGSNRLSTVVVENRDGLFRARIWRGMPKGWLFVAESASYGAPTIAQALRSLQEVCECMRNRYGGAARTLQASRTPSPGKGGEKR